MKPFLEFAKRWIVGAMGMILALIVILIGSNIIGWEQAKFGIEVAGTFAWVVACLILVPWLLGCMFFFDN